MNVCGYFLFVEFRDITCRVLLKVNDLFFVQWFVAIEMQHCFLVYQLGKLSGSLLDYKITLKRNRFLGHESSFARQLSHERFVTLVKFLLSF